MYLSKYATQPIKEEELLNGYLEPTNQWYAIAKIAGLKLCEALNRQYKFNSICLMPTNLYDLETIITQRIVMFYPL